MRYKSAYIVQIPIRKSYNIVLIVGASFNWSHKNQAKTKNQIIQSKYFVAAMFTMQFQMSLSNKFIYWMFMNTHVSHRFRLLFRMAYCYRLNAVECCTIIRNINIDYFFWIEMFANDNSNNVDNVDDVKWKKRVHSNMSVKRRGLQINNFEICIEITST